MTMCPLQRSDWDSRRAMLVVLEPTQESHISVSVQWRQSLPTAFKTCATAVQEVAGHVRESHFHSLKQRPKRPTAVRLNASKASQR